MHEQRKLTEIELDALLDSASDGEKNGILNVCKSMQMKPIDFITRYAVDWDGLIINGRPVYVAAVVESGNIFELWTVVASDVKEQLTLFKCAKKGMAKWSSHIPKIYATMMKSWAKNRVWTERLGFKPHKETEDTITYVYQRD